MILFDYLFFKRRKLATEDTVVVKDCCVLQLGTFFKEGQMIFLNFWRWRHLKRQKRL